MGDDTDTAETIKAACKQLNLLIGAAWGLGLRIEVEVEEIRSTDKPTALPLVDVRVSRLL
jgi:hypothetical protein